MAQWWSDHLDELRAGGKVIKAKFALVKAMVASGLVQSLVVEVQSALRDHHHN